MKRGDSAESPSVSPQPIDDRVQAVLEVDERAVRPQSLAQLLASDQIARPAPAAPASTLSDCSCRPDEHAGLAQFARRADRVRSCRIGPAARAGAGISAIATPCQEQPEEAAAILARTILAV